MTEKAWLIKFILSSSIFYKHNENIILLYLRNKKNAFESFNYQV